jgi:hypothetical protein
VVDSPPGAETLSYFRSSEGWSDPARIGVSGTHHPRVGIDDAGAAIVVFGGFVGVWLARTLDGLSWSFPASIGQQARSHWNVSTAANGMAIGVWRDRSAGPDLYGSVFR